MAFFTRLLTTRFCVFIYYYYNYLTHRTRKRDIPINQNDLRTMIPSKLSNSKPRLKYKGKIKLCPQKAKVIALSKQLTRHSRRRQISQTRSSRQKRQTKSISSAARDYHNKLPQSLSSSSITSRNKMMQILFYRVVHSVINLIVCLKQQSSPSHHISALRTTLSSKPK